MGVQIHAVPQCPECKCYDNRVVMTTYPLAGDCDIARRRCCNICGHRWWSGQRYEFPIKLEWGSRQSGALPEFAEEIYV